MSSSKYKKLKEVNMAEIVLNSNYISISQKQGATTSSLFKSYQKKAIYLKRTFQKTIFFQIWLVLKAPVI